MFAETCINKNIEAAVDSLESSLDPFNYLQTLISADYLLMKELKKQCLIYLEQNIHLFLMHAFN